MEFKLKELQKKADELLTEVAQLRRDCPTELRSSFESFIADQQKLNLPEFYLENSNKIYAENIQLDPSQLGRLGDELDRLQKLNQSIPDLAAKLERAKAVLDDAPKNGAQSEEHQIINTDQLSEMEARQRQITRQMDLAGRLLSLQS